ncbi:MAG: hypothetical protein LUM44_22250 [Pyrinomonadaceae bacterium]|nr:hypothetical protein [Pyrinomonadaceae bacterium]
MKQKAGSLELFAPIEEPKAAKMELFAPRAEQKVAKVVPGTPVEEQKAAILEQKAPSLRFGTPKLHLLAPFERCASPSDCKNPGSRRLSICSRSIRNKKNGRSPFFLF